MDTTGVLGFRSCWGVGPSSSNSRTHRNSSKLDNTNM